MNKRSLFKESFYATGFILVSLYFLSKIEINSDVVNPIAKALGDFNITDIAFSHMRKSNDVDTNIVMVNIGPFPERDRVDLARLINVLNYYEPKVIGIDAFYRQPRKDHTVDSILIDAFSRVKNLVLVSENHENPNPDLKIIDSMETSHAIFMKYAEPGFADMITKSKDHFKTSRECSPKERVRIVKKRTYVDTTLTVEVVTDDVITKVKKDTTLCKVEYLDKDTIYYSFPSKIVSIYAPEKAKAFIDRNNETEIINFLGNIDTREEDVAIGAKNVFFALDWYQVEDTLFDPSVIKDKIVIIGYLGDVLGDNSWEDKFFTPLNANYIGKANPDMYGVVVHANIVSMILRGEFIDEMPFWLNFIFSILFIFFNVWFFSYLYFRTEEWYDGLSLLLTLAQILVLIFIVVNVFSYYDYKIDITFASVALLLTGNLIEIHFGIILPSFLKIKGKIKFLNKNNSIFIKN